MTLTRCSDLTTAGWLTGSDLPWDQLVEFGPAGFAAYARLRFLPDPTHPGQFENDVDLDDGASPAAAQLSAAVDVLARSTRTPDDCYFCLWDGWVQQVHGTGAVYPGAGYPGAGWTGAAMTRADYPGADEAVPGIDPSFVPSTSADAMVVVPNRAYFLFRGTVADVDEWASGSGWPGQTGAGAAEPAFIWPADHAWCIANDVDPHWAGIGASASAIDQLTAHPGLDVVHADPRANQPRYR